MEDKKKVNALLKSLNNGQVAGAWVPGDGFHAIVSVKNNDDGSQAINLNRGMTVKLFVNQNTGEVRVFLEETVK